MERPDCCCDSDRHGIVAAAAFAFGQLTYGVLPSQRRSQPAPQDDQECRPIRPHVPLSRQAMQCGATAATPMLQGVCSAVCVVPLCSSSCLQKRHCPIQAACDASQAVGSAQADVRRHARYADLRRRCVGRLVRPCQCGRSGCVLWCQCHGALGHVDASEAQNAAGGLHLLRLWRPCQM